MIPAAFDYVRATSLAHAIDLLGRDPDGSKLLAGGHTLIPTLKLRLATPALLIDIGGIADLKGIEIAESIRIGALTTHAELLASEPLHRVLPIVRQTADQIADPQVRNRGTIGGSLANADPAADWPAIVVVLKAELELAGPKGRRQVNARDFFLDIMTTALDGDEVLVAIHLPRPEPGTRLAYRKVRHPASGYAVVGVAAAARVSDGVVQSATIAVTGAASCVFAADAAAAALVGKPLTPEAIASAAALVLEEAECLADHYAPAAYREQLVRTETARALASFTDPL